MLLLMFPLILSIILGRFVPSVGRVKRMKAKTYIFIYQVTGVKWSEAHSTSGLCEADRAGPSWPVRTRQCNLCI